ncbi:MAG TPA: hypothetical protein VFV70_06930 [Hyphomonadaceae bacterium]|nr:hypothetical protein [Hyphomonadaceae bacterium]
MPVKLVVMVVTVCLLTACQQPQQPVEAARAEPLDPFAVMIDAERWGVIIDKAREGVREAPGPNETQFDNEIYRADASLKSSAAELIALRNEACVKGLVTGAACNLGDWPAWTREQPTDKTPIEEIQRRSDWLSAQMDPFTSAGCEAGRKATGDELFCSVE